MVRRKTPKQLAIKIRSLKKQLTRVEKQRKRLLKVKKKPKKRRRKRR